LTLVAGGRLAWSKLSMSGLGQRVAKPVGSEKDVSKGRVQTTTVRRYWAGKAPAWLEEKAEPAPVAEPRKDAEPAETEGERVVRTEVQAPVIVARKSDPRLARLQASRGDLSEAREEHRQNREREISRASAVARPGSSAEDEEPQDEEALEARRAAIRARMAKLEAQAQADEGQGGAAEGSSEETDEDSEEETDDETDEDDAKIARPIFVPKRQREVEREREAQREAEEREAELEKARAEERRQATKAMVAEAIQLEQQRENAKDDETVALEAVDTDDDDEDEAEFESWRQRELGRIRRAHTERADERRKLEEAQRLRSMTEEERLAQLSLRRETEEKRGKMKFMQKYYHKGAFFQSDADDKTGTVGTFEILQRDFSAPVGMDKFDKTALPSVLHVRSNDFGKRARSKWTHLMAEDTTADPRGKAPFPDMAEAEAPGKRPPAPSLGAPLVLKKRPLTGTDMVFDKPKKFKT